MSRLGKLPIELPKGVEIQVQRVDKSDERTRALNQNRASGDNLDTKIVLVKGPKGELKRSLPSFIDVTIEDRLLLVKPNRELTSKFERAMWGTVRSHLNNMVIGVSRGWEKQLEINGIGYVFKLSGSILSISCGYSHDVLVRVPEGITCVVDKNILRISGYDKEAVGNFAGKVLAVRKADVYLGKGIKYVGQTIRRKAGKSVKK
ncbi:MAG: 50S ribosomal protein L6 [Deltaproteobacteria bacterium]|nr:50S ribosomal protein L6 [Deltaproteobacteria bacterium]